MEKTIENMDRNRLGILIRCLVILLITGVTNSAAVFVSPLAAHFNWTADAIANVSTTMLLCWTPGALIGGTLMSKIGARNAMLLGAVLFPLGTLTSSFVPQSSPWLLYVTFSFLQGLGNGLAYTVATYVSTGWYPDKRGLVSGLCMAFTGGSSAFLAPICSKLVQSTGIISTLRIVGLVSLVVCVVCALGVRQAPVGYTPAGFAGSASSAETQLESYNVRRALKTRPIWHLIVCTAFFPTMYMIMFPRFSVYMTDAGFTLSAATLGVSIYFIANTLSRLFLGALCDKISYKHVYGICGVLCILSAICLIAAHSLFMFYLGYALLGLGFGATNSVYPVTINKSYGPVYAGGIYGVALFGYMIFCTLITPRISAALVASTGGYTASFIYGIVLSCVAVVSIKKDYFIHDERQSMSGSKEAIGLEACKLIEPNDIVLIDTGSTTECMLKHLNLDFPITVVGYTLNTMVACQNRSNISLICGGGFYHRNTELFDSPEGVALISRLNINKCFMAAAGVTSKGNLSCIEPYEFMYKKAAINSSSTRILLVDSSKFGKMRPCMFSNLSDFDMVITDSNIGGNWIRLFEQSNLKYIIV